MKFSFFLYLDKSYINSIDTCVEVDFRKTIRNLDKLRYFIENVQAEPIPTALLLFYFFPRPIFFPKYSLLIRCCCSYNFS